MVEQARPHDIFVYNRNDEDDRRFAADLVERLTAAGYQPMTRAAFDGAQPTAAELRKWMETSRSTIVIVGSAIDAADDLAQAAVIEAAIRAGQRVAAVVSTMLTGLPKEISRAACFNLAGGVSSHAALEPLLAWLGPSS